MGIEICFAQPFLYQPFVVEYLSSRFPIKKDIGCTLSIVSLERSNIRRLDGIITSLHWTITIIIISNFLAQDNDFPVF